MRQRLFHVGIRSVLIELIVYVIPGVGELGVRGWRHLARQPWEGLCQLQGSWWLLAFVLQCDMMPQECLQGTTAPEGPRHNVIAANQSEDKMCKTKLHAMAKRQNNFGSEMAILNRNIYNGKQLKDQGLKMGSCTFEVNFILQSVVKILTAAITYPKYVIAVEPFQPLGYRTLEKEERWSLEGARAGTQMNNFICMEELTELRGNCSEKLFNKSSISL
ncbi:hypothetical protein Q9966_001095 [Columba livia]|nr:hypothetical protein Q9966_001095 [Columba livia]